MGADRQGLVLTGSGEAIAAYDRAVDHLIRFQPEVMDAVAAAVAADPGCVMGRVFGAYLGLMSTEARAVAAAREALGPFADDDGDERKLLPRERTHLAAARRWAGGDMAAAGALLGDISIQYPRDLLALAVGHQIDFFRGDAVTLRDRVGRALNAWDGADQQSGFVHGMFAFGLEECNQYDRSAEAGQRAVEINPDDVWGIHAVAHTFEMRGQIPDGVRFMRERRHNWTQGNFLNVHNAWHFALYLLQADDVAGALAVYDTFLHHTGSDDVALELLDASALLWRLQLEGVSAGDRWRPLAQAWARLLAPGFYPFNDMHAIMAFIGTGELNRAREVVAALERVVRERDQSDTGSVMTSVAGLPVCRSLVHFASGEYEQVLSLLLPIRTRIHEFGGSHAQRDAVERTLLEAAIRAGRTDLANALVSERLAVRECSTYAWSKRAVLLAAAGNTAGAASAAARERELAGQIRSAAAGFGL
ncbi:MAG TPA: tetratricopeptide repeat protein [Streptosporangiaceae bacterium]